MAKFNKGDMVILISSYPEQAYSIGYEYEVLGHAFDGRAIIFNSNDFCELSVSGVPNGAWVAKESALKLRKPKEEPATWQEIQDEFGWNPTKEVAL